MSSNLFKKCIAFGDIHFGLKHNSRDHNQDCEDFIIWMIEQAKARGAETCFFLGDWHHHRASVNVSTLNYTVSNLERLSENFDTVYFIAGNHDLYYKEKREIHSLPMAKRFKNIVMVDTPFIDKDVAVLPWLVGDEWKKIEKLDVKYVFGHFELPGYKMNAMVEMPDHGGLKAEHFKSPDYVFSGHFHKRQQRGKVHYIGNPFGHNYADVWDFDRGCMYLEWDKEPEYINYEAGPRYISVTLSSLVSEPEKYLTPSTFAKVLVDINISYEEASFLRETFISNYNIRELRLVPQTDEENITVKPGDIKFETVDQIVLDQLSQIDSENFDKQTLISIYNNL